MTDKAKSDVQNSMSAAFSDLDAAERYKNAENATLPFAEKLVEKAGLAQLSGEAHIFDCATGTGAVVKEIYEAVPKNRWGGLSVLGGDSSSAMVNYLQARAEKEGWVGVTTQVIDGNKDINLPKASFTHIFVSFAVFAMPNVLPKLYELLKPGGYMGITTWAFFTWQPLLARCISMMKDKPFNPSPSDLENKMFGGHNWAEMSYVASQLSSVGLVKVDTMRHEVKAACGTPKLFMETMQFPLKMITSFWDEEKREEWLDELNGIMYREVSREAGGEDESVVLEFDANIGWGWKSG